VGVLPLASISAKEDPASCARLYAVRFVGEHTQNKRIHGTKSNVSNLLADLPLVVRLDFAPRDYVIAL
jgi:hypothetical protein